MNTVHNDFFFGEYQMKDEQSFTIGLGDFLKRSIRVSPEFFTDQVNRFLDKCEGVLVLSHGTSYPDFDLLLDKLVLNRIGHIDISMRDDVNTLVKATLDCSLCLERGLLRLEPHWCARTVNRSDELVSTLLLPLHITGLCDRASLCQRNSDGSTVDRSALVHIESHRAELHSVFALAEYMIKEDDDFPLDEYTYQLEVADVVHGMKLTGESARAAYRRQLASDCKERFRENNSLPSS